MVMIIAIDFDGTCVTHSFPSVGTEIGAESVLKDLVKEGHELILWTMRSNNTRPDHITEEAWPLFKESVAYLDHAVKWFKDNDIELYGIQVNPLQDEWTDSPKAYAQLYIDDAALGCPLSYDLIRSIRPFVDWIKVREMLVNKGILNE